MVPLMNKWLAFAVVSALSACSVGTTGGMAQKQSDQAIETSSYPASTFTQAGLKARYSGATSLSYSPQHGTQIEFMSADGKAFLWYPGNQRAVVGHWKTDAPIGGSQFARICWKYGRSTFNPVTRKWGGTYNCQSAKLHLTLEKEYTLGDPFGLSSGNIPYVLKKKRRYTLQQAAAPLGISVKRYR